MHAPEFQVKFKTLPAIATVMKESAWKQPADTEAVTAAQKQCILLYVTEEETASGWQGQKEKLEHNLQEAYSPSTMTKEERVSSLQPEPAEPVAKDPKS